MKAPRKQRQSTDDKPDAIEFEKINGAIDQLLKQLAAKGLCPCCVSQGLMWRGALLHQEIVGADETVGLCLDIVDTIEPDDNNVIPTSSTQH